MSNARILISVSVILLLIGSFIFADYKYIGITYYGNGSKHAKEKIAEAAIKKMRTPKKASTPAPVKLAEKVTPAPVAVVDTTTVPVVEPEPVVEEQKPEAKPKKKSKPAVKTTNAKDSVVADKQTLALKGNDTTAADSVKVAKKKGPPHG